MRSQIHTKGSASARTALSGLLVFLLLLIWQATPALRQGRPGLPATGSSAAAALRSLPGGADHYKPAHGAVASAKSFDERSNGLPQLAGLLPALQDLPQGPGYRHLRRLPVAAPLHGPPAPQPQARGPPAAAAQAA